MELTEEVKAFLKGEAHKKMFAQTDLRKKHDVESKESDKIHRALVAQQEVVYESAKVIDAGDEAFADLLLLSGFEGTTVRDLVDFFQMAEPGDGSSLLHTLSRLSIIIQKRRETDASRTVSSPAGSTGED